MPPARRNPHFFYPESEVPLSWSLLRPKSSNFELHFFEKAPKQTYQNQSRKHLRILRRRPPRRFRSPQQKTWKRLFGPSFRPTKKRLLRKPSWTEKLSILRRPPLRYQITFRPPNLHKCCCGCSGVPGFQKPPHQQHVFFKVPFEITNKNMKNAFVEQTTHFATSFRGRFSKQACADNASKLKQNMFYSWNGVSTNPCGFR